MNWLITKFSLIPVEIHIHINYILMSAILIHNDLNVPLEYQKN